MTTENNIASFAAKVKTKPQPTQEPQADLQQAIILNALENISIFSYVIEIGKIIKPINIRAVSRISNNRISIFLSDKKFVDQLVTDHKTIHVENALVEVRRMISNNVRVIISNVNPIIPNKIILDSLKSYGIEPQSTINPLKAGFRDKEYMHILSFRRQVYIKEEDKSKVPETIKLMHMNTEVRIFLTFDSPPCTNCRQHGHTADSCNTHISQHSTTNSNQEGIMTNLNTILKTNSTANNLTSLQDNEANNKTDNLISRSQTITTNQDNVTTNLAVTLTKSSEHNETNQSDNIEKNKNCIRTIPTLENPSNHNPKYQKLVTSTPISSPTVSHPQNPLKDNAKNQEQTTSTHSYNKPHHIDINTVLPERYTKRPAGVTSLSENSDSLEAIENPHWNERNNKKTGDEEMKNKRKTKKQRPASNKSNETTEELLNCVEIEIKENPEEYELSYEQFRDFAENANGSNDPLGISKDYTNDTQALINMINKIYPLLTNPKIKNRMTRIQNKIKTQIQDEQVDDDTNQSE